eukprot:TRINITY_DN2192_c0_g1_i5.p1 TRINITY_DN2192_c0_g1~~TRINITY_DN2192_c0_g1_i5.p1  ORF type:complete len:223 (+),score=48.93 TRINITY_DN2192_c0_g1_i5:58-726(+)
MAWRSSGTNLRELISNLKKSKIIQSVSVERAMLAIDRKDFCPSSPYEDSPQRIGMNATISAPHMHAYALELLAPVIKESSKILDVGSGSGYLTACFSIMAPEGHVVGIEHIPDLVSLSISNIRKSNASLLETDRIKIIVGDGRQGYVESGPYDAIHVGAAAPELPTALLDQLAPGGRLVIPVGTHTQELIVCDKDQHGRVKQQAVMGVIYVPLTTVEHQLRR